MDTILQAERFSAEDIADLRSDLMQSGLDSWQAAELVTSFLTARGYGVSSEGARDVVTQMDGLHSTVECMRAQLERVALVM